MTEENHDGWETLKILGVNVLVHVENGSFGRGLTWRCTSKQIKNINLSALGHTPAEVQIRFRRLVEEVFAAGRLSLKDLHKSSEGPAWRRKSRFSIAS